MIEPKVFISYSWTDQAHQELVKNWADRLIADGVDVILDIYDLKEGDDKYAFMESMVTDPKVTHVLVICDRAYSERADDRKAGVGIESQIISAEVYEKVKQSKFIPIVCEFGDDGEAILPTFMKSRIWINFSSPEAENENWERLVRLLYGKPQYVKPKKGKAPTSITAETPAPTSEVMAKFNLLRQAVLQNKKGVRLYRRDFIDVCISFADGLRIRERPNVQSMGEKVLQDCSKLKAIRDHFCDWVRLECETCEDNEFSESLVDVLEKLGELKSRPSGLDSWNNSWFEAHSVFVYETFLYIVAALLKSGSYGVLHEIFTSQYLISASYNNEGLKLRKFDCFFGCSESLQTVLAPEGKRLYSPAAELIKRQSDREDVRFQDIMQADLLILLMSFITPETRWFPQTLYYSSYGSGYPFFLKAAQNKYFKNLSIVTGIESADELRKKVSEGQERMSRDGWHKFHFDRSFWSSMNMDKLDTVK